MAEFIVWAETKRDKVAITLNVALEAFFVLALLGVGSLVTDCRCLPLSQLLAPV